MPLAGILRPPMVSFIGSPRTRNIALSCLLALCAASRAAPVPPREEPAPAAATERQIAKLLEEQQRLMAQLKREVEGPEAAATRDERRAQIARLLADIEERMKTGAFLRTCYVSSAAEDPTINAYRQRLQRRVDEQLSRNFPKVDGVSLQGRVVLVMALLSNGKIQGADIVKTSSPKLSAHTLRVLKSMEPLEQFPAEIAKQCDRMLFPAPFVYTQD